MFSKQWNYLLVRICLLLTRGWLGNVGSWGELVKFTVPSTQKLLWRFVVQWMNDLFLLNMTETWHHFIWILFLKESNQSQVVSNVSLVKQSVSQISSFSDCFCNCIPVLHNVLILLSKFKVTCGAMDFSVANDLF